MFKKMVKRRDFRAMSIALMAVLIVGCAGFLVHGPKDSWVGVADHIRPATVQIMVGQVNEITEQDELLGTGSGFLITSTGLIVTAAHVVDGLDTLYRPWVRVRFHNGDELPVLWAKGNVGSDIAVLKIQGDDLPFLKFEDKPLREGEPVLAMGSNSLSTWAVTDGIVSKVQMLYDLNIGHGWMQMTASVNPGFSGGPVVNARGNVVGVTVAFFPYQNDVYIAAPGNIAKLTVQNLLKGKSLVPDKD